MKNIIELERTIRRRKLDRDLMRRAKRSGFSDVQLAVMKKTTESKMRALRKNLKSFRWQNK